MTTPLQREFRWVDLDAPGHLSVGPCPAGWEEMEDDLRFLKEAGVDVVVSALTPDQAEVFGVSEEGDACALVGMEYLSIPIRDHDVPPMTGATERAIERVAERLADGHNVLIHCLAGVGRSPLIGAGALIVLGMTAAEALDYIGAARGFPVPETREQLEWIHDFEQRRAHA